MIGQFLVSTIFNIFNVAVLFGIIWYFYRTRARAQLLQAMAQTEAAHEILKQKIVLSTSEYEVVQEATLAQKNYYKTLAAHVQQWRLYEASLIAAGRREQELLAKKIQERYALQQHGLIMLYAQKQLLPLAIKQAESTVTQQFADQQKGKEYMAAAVKQLAALPVKQRGSGYGS